MRGRPSVERCGDVDTLPKACVAGWRACALLQPYSSNRSNRPLTLSVSSRGSRAMRLERRARQSTQRTWSASTTP